MRAIQMTEQGGPEVLRLVEVPAPVPGPGQVLVRVDAASVNFADVMRRRGDAYPIPTPSPFVPGGEVAGTVAALGDGVDHLPVGTAVFGIVGADPSGGYAEFAVASASNIIPIPEGLEPDVAAGIVVAGLTATMILAEAARVSEGDTVFVPAAAGGVGSYAVQIAKLLGAANVIAAASTPGKREVALKLGADHAVDYSADGWTHTVRELTADWGVDVALEMSGPASLNKTLGILAPFGRLVVYGAANGTTAELDRVALLRMLYDPQPNQTLTSFNLGVWFQYRAQTAVAALERLVGWIASGQLATPAVHALPLADAAEAHRLLETGSTTGKVVLKP
jgi:NADPH:quinone reductase